jgi:agmatinase
MLETFDPNAAAQADAGIYGLPVSPDDAGVILIPVPWEVTTSYRPGTAGGPDAILEASRQVDLFDVETGRPYRAGIAMLEVDPDIVAWNREGRQLARGIIAAGGGEEGTPGLARVNALGGLLNARVEAIAETWLGKGRIVGLVGGDHAAPYGLMRAVARRYPGLGVLHVDAHADLRRAYEGFTWSHASIMDNVMQGVPEIGRLVQVGLRDLCEEEHERIRESQGRIVAHFDADLAARTFNGESWAAQCQRIVKDLPHEVYVSFDIDGLDPTLCPSTGTPVPGGLSFREACQLFSTVVSSGRHIVGFDLDEVAPGEDGNEWDANVGARLLYKLIGRALESQGKTW